MSARRRGGAAALVPATLALLALAPGAASAERPPAPELAAAPATQLVRAGHTDPSLVRRYAQRVAGLPVLDAELVLAGPHGAAPAVVADTTVAGISARGRRATISRERAVRRARRATGAATLRAPARARLGIDPRSGRTAWEVELPAARPLADHLVLVDARSGAALRSRDLLWRATGRAALFDPNPVVAQGDRAGLRDAKDRDSELLAALRVPVSLPRITSAAGCLTGAYVDARMGKRARPVCDPSLEFGSVQRSNDRFEALMAYFHVDRTRAYVESLGLSRGLRARPQRVRANGIRDDNSYYSSLTRSMTLGRGGVDDGEDADVIVHEYGHSLQDQAVPGFGRSTGAAAIGEGFGDYLAAAASARVTGGDPRFDACVFDWDAVSYSRDGCGRRADRGLGLRRAKKRCFGQVHCLGEVWAGALYELRGRLGEDAAGRSVMDRVVLESNFMLARRSGFGDAARALLAADALLYGGVHAPVIEAEMRERRILSRRGGRAGAR